MRFAFALALIGLVASAAMPAAARPFTLKGPRIEALLTGATVKAKQGWTQRFEAGGRTVYEEGGRTSEGSWQVRGDQYCSQWPPSDQWNCYAVLLDQATEPPTVIWRDETGEGATAELIERGTNP